MNKSKLTEFLKDISFNTDYSFLEAGKDDKELQKIADKRGIKLPAQDLAIFKGKYAFTDRTNLNGCSLPKAEVEKSLGTLVGKAIDFDHIRERIVGFWLDAELIGDVIYAYGAFFKSNLAEDYTLIKELMDKKNLGISFEAYGMREFKDDGTYNLNDIEWAGGALLINTKPAFPGAGVLELANKRVMEFASTLVEPKDYIKSAEQKKLEVARMYTSDMESIMRLCGEAVCPMCKSVGTFGIDEIDFKENCVEATCYMCNASVELELTPKSTMLMPDMEDSSRTIKNVVQKEKKEEGSMSEIKTETPSIEKAEDLIKNEEETIEKAEVEEVVVEEVAEETIETVVKEAEVEVKAEEAKAEEINVEEPVVNAELTALKAELATIKEQLAKARDEGKVIGERRSFLGDYAKDMSDDDVLDAIKFENASLKKKVAELESKTTTEVASVKKEATPLEIGSKDKTKDSEIDAFAKKVRNRAFSI
jgi:hypothetical protein